MKCPFKKKTSYLLVDSRSYGGVTIPTRSEEKEEFTECLKGNCMAYDGTFGKCRLTNKNN